MGPASRPQRGAPAALPLLAALAALGACDGASDAPGRAAREPAPSAADGGPPWFREEARARGIDFVHASGHDRRYLFPEITAGGAALFDMDGDGDLDAFLVQSAPEAGGHRLYRNDGAGRFEDVSAAAGVALPGYGNGVAAGDYDGDGDLDLYVTGLGPNRLLRNDGAGRFEDATGAAGVGEERWSTGACFFDFDADGDLDLFAANYVDWSEELEAECLDYSGLPGYCNPLQYEPEPDTLYRNEGDGTFVDVSDAAGVRAAFGNGLGVAAGDLDGDGRLDLFVANDGTADQLWRNQGDGTFRDVAPVWGCAVDANGRARAGMGVDVLDVDGDDDLDLFVVHLGDEYDGFLRNQGRYFTEETTRVGIGHVSRPFTRFGVGFHDFDLDGQLDVYLANGRVNLRAEPLVERDPYAEPNLLLRGTGEGRWQEVRPRGGTAEELLHTSRAAAFGDVDGDGDVDVLVANKDAPPYLLIDVAERRGHWLLLRVLERNGAPALGASVRLSAGGSALRREVKAAYSYCASSDPRVHLGLGPHERVTDVRVRWVDGVEEDFGELGADREVALRRGAGRAAQR